jgi:hypothetical protein
MCTFETPETPTSTRAVAKVSGGSIHIEQNKQELVVFEWNIIRIPK